MDHGRGTCLLYTSIGTPLGALVGYQVRFEDQSDDSTLVKLMTDGILLAETQHDRYLERYDTLIVDEAHERSLNIDFLLGYLKTLLHRRPAVSYTHLSSGCCWRIWWFRLARSPTTLPQPPWSAKWPSSSASAVRPWPRWSIA